MRIPYAVWRHGVYIIPHLTILAQRGAVGESTLCVKIIICQRGKERPSNAAFAYTPKCAGRITPDAGEGHRARRAFEGAFFLVECAVGGKCHPYQRCVRERVCYQPLYMRVYIIPRDLPDLLERVGALRARGVVGMRKTCIDKEKNLRLRLPTHPDTLLIAEL